MQTVESVISNGNECEFANYGNNRINFPAFTKKIDINNQMVQAIRVHSNYESQSNICNVIGNENFEA